MSRLKSVAEKFGFGSAGSVIRMKGFRKSKRLTLYFGHAMESQIVTIPIAEVAAGSFNVRSVESGAEYNLEFVGTKTIKIAKFSSEEEAKFALAKIAKQVAPSFWRLVAKIALLLIIYSFLTQESGTENRQVYESQLPRPVVPPMPSLPIPSPQASAPVQQTAPDDPYGLKISPAQK